MHETSLSCCRTVRLVNQPDNRDPVFRCSLFLPTALHSTQGFSLDNSSSFALYPLSGLSIYQFPVFSWTNAFVLEVSHWLEVKQQSNVMAQEGALHTYCLV